ncbi:MAG: hypothetical protein ACJAVI_000071 [Candidatus Azotimanducaceae bacterium]|jgi:hypothetical protein
MAKAPNDVPVENEMNAARRNVLATSNSGVGHPGLILLPGSKRDD